MPFTWTVHTASAIGVDELVDGDAWATAIKDYLVNTCGLSVANQSASPTGNNVWYDMEIGLPANNLRMMIMGNVNSAQIGNFTAYTGGSLTSSFTDSGDDVWFGVARISGAYTPDPLVAGAHGAWGDSANVLEATLLSMGVERTSETPFIQAATCDHGLVICFPNSDGDAQWIIAGDLLENKQLNNELICCLTGGIPSANLWWSNTGDTAFLPVSVETSSRQLAPVCMRASETPAAGSSSSFIPNQIVRNSTFQRSADNGDGFNCMSIEMWDPSADTSKGVLRQIYFGPDRQGTDEVRDSGNTLVGYWIGSSNASAKNTLYLGDS